MIRIAYINKYKYMLHSLIIICLSVAIILQIKAHNVDPKIVIKFWLDISRLGVLISCFAFANYFIFKLIGLLLNSMNEKLQDTESEDLLIKKMLPLLLKGIVPLVLLLIEMQFKLIPKLEQMLKL